MPESKLKNIYQKYISIHTIKLMSLFMLASSENKMNEVLGHLCAHKYRLNWARRTFWRWWDDTALQTQDSKFALWLSEAEHITSWSRRLPTIMNLCEWAFWNILLLLNLGGQRGGRNREKTVQAGSFNHCTRSPALNIIKIHKTLFMINTFTRCRFFLSPGGSLYMIVTVPTRVRNPV